MASVVTKLNGFEQKHGESRNGPYVLTIFTADDGKKFQTFDEDTATMLQSKVGESIDLEFEVVSRSGRNGKTFTNNNIIGLAGDKTMLAEETPMIVQKMDYYTRSDALRMAIDVAKVTGIENVSFDELVDIAEAILAYTLGEEENTGPEAFTPVEEVIPN